MFVKVLSIEDFVKVTKNILGIEIYKYALYVRCSSRLFSFSSAAFFQKIREHIRNIQLTKNIQTIESMVEKHSTH